MTGGGSMTGAPPTTDKAALIFIDRRVAPRSENSEQQRPEQAHPESNRSHHVYCSTKAGSRQAPVDCDNADTRNPRAVHAGDRFLPAVSRFV